MVDLEMYYHEPYYDNKGVQLGQRVLLSAWESNERDKPGRALLLARALDIPAKASVPPNPLDSPDVLDRVRLDEAVRDALAAAGIGSAVVTISRHIRTA